MEEQEKNNAGQHPIENVLYMSAYDMAKSVNASIGITAYGKASLQLSYLSHDSFPQYVRSL